MGGGGTFDFLHSDLFVIVYLVFLYLCVCVFVFVFVNCLFLYLSLFARGPPAVSEREEAGRAVFF